jgi:hypothetical protein
MADPFPHVFFRLRETTIRGFVLGHIKGMQGMAARALCS